jgi:hypothetical protein
LSLAILRIILPFMATIERLYVVYNADSDWWSLLVDVVRKFAGRDECPLCTLTHGATGERSSWQECKQSLGVPVEAVHRDELTPPLRALDAPLPFIAVEASRKLEVLLDKTAVLALEGNTDALERALRAQAQARGLEFP